MVKKKCNNFVAVFCMLLFFVTSLFAQKTDIKVDGQIIKDYITFLAQDKFLGRKANTPEIDKVLNWAKNKFKKWGLEPAGNNGDYFQEVPLTGSRAAFAYTLGTPKMFIDKREFFARYGDFQLDYRSTTGKKIKGEIVFAGYGISAPEKGLDEYAGINVKGKFVLVLKGSPNDAPAMMSFFSPGEEESGSEEDWDVESRDSSKVNTAYAKGAAGILIYNPEASNRMSRFGGFRGRTKLEESKYERDFMVVPSISERVFRWIMWRDPQESSRGFQSRITKIQNEIKKKKTNSFTTGLTMEIQGYKSSILKGKDFGDSTCFNVLGKITGTDPVLKNEFIVLGGHIDHVGVRNGQITNGADDNASGSSVVLEVARLMKKHKIRTKRTIIFGLWTGEEMGLIGSRYWVKNPTLGISMDQVVTNFNMDMVALGDKIGVPGALNFPDIWEIIKRNQDPDILDAIEPSEAGPGGSDFAPFIELGIEALALMTRGGGGHPDYHDTGDDAEKSDPEILRKTAKFVLQGTINVGNEPGSLFIPQRQHLYDGMRWNITAMDPNLKISGGWTVLQQTSKTEMAEAINEKIKELKKPSSDRQPQRRMFRRMMRTGGKMSQGINGGKAVGFDIEFMQIAKNVLGFGRIDVDDDDGVWFSNGITEEGKDALKAMEDNGITLRLINPTETTFNAVLAAAEKPFMVCGMEQFTPEQISQINEKKILIGVDFDSNNFSDCLTKLEALKAKIGDSDNLRLNLVSDENLDKSKKELYIKLIDKGWSKDEIYALGGSAGGRRRR